MLTLPLNEEDIEMLRHIHRNRLRFFVQVCLGLLVMVVYASYDGYLTSIRFEYLPFGLRILSCSVPGVIVLICMTVFYRSRVGRVRRDIKNGLKEQVPRIITGKLYFEHTGQYFICFDDPAYKHHELPYAVWNSLSEGDTFNLYRAPLCGYVFNPTGKYTIL